MPDSTVDQAPSSAKFLAVSTPGEHMQQARLALELSIDAVAARLKISAPNLLALEADQYEKLPGETFVRGYIRAYARLLGIDCDAALASYEDYLQVLRNTTAQVTHNKGGKHTALPLKNRRQIAVALTAIVIVIVLSVVFSLSGSGELALGANSALNEGSHSAPSEPGASTDITADPVAGENAQLINDAAIGQKTAVEVISDAREVKALALAPPVETPVSTPLVTSAEDQLTLSFTSECWVEIADARGDVLLTNLKQAGESVSLQGKAPFNVMLGDVRSVRIELNGKPVPIKPKDNRKALRFKVGA